MPRFPILAVVVVGFQLAACSNSGGSSPPSPAVNPATASGSGTGQQDDSSSSASGDSAGLDGNTTTPGTIRSAQVTQLNSEINALEGLLGIYQGSTCPGFEESITGSQLATLPQPGGSGPQTLAGGLLTGAGDAAVGGFASGGYNTDAALTAYTSGAQGVGAGITAAVVQNQVNTGNAALQAQSQQELNSCNSEITNLQGQIAQKQQQIDELNAQGTQ